MSTASLTTGRGRKPSPPPDARASPKRVNEQVAPQDLPAVRYRPLLCAVGPCLPPSRQRSRSVAAPCSPVPISGWRRGAVISDQPVSDRSPTDYSLMGTTPSTPPSLPTRRATSSPPTPSTLWSTRCRTTGATYSRWSHSCGPRPSHRWLSGWRSPVRFRFAARRSTPTSPSSRGARSTTRTSRSRPQKSSSTLVCGT